MSYGHNTAYAPQKLFPTFYILQSLIKGVNYFMNLFLLRCSQQHRYIYLAPYIYIISIKELSFQIPTADGNCVLFLTVAKLEPMNKLSLKTHQELFYTPKVFISIMLSWRRWFRQRSLRSKSEENGALKFGHGSKRLFKRTSCCTYSSFKYFWYFIETYSYSVSLVSVSWIRLLYRNKIETSDCFSRSIQIFKIKMTAQRGPIPCS